MTRIHLKDANDAEIQVDQDETARVTIVPKDYDGTAIAKASLDTIQATLTHDDGTTITVINSRDDQDIKDANNGTVATSGTITLLLQVLDNIIVDTNIDENETEEHVLMVQWTSGAATHRQEFVIVVRKVART